MKTAAVKYTLSILVEDKPSVLTRVAGLFGRRAFNIHSLAVGNTEKPGISRITIVTDEFSAPIEQICQQLLKLVNVLRVDVLDSEAAVDREIALVKVTAPADEPEKRSSVIEVANLFRAKVVDVAPKSVVIEATGAQGKLKGLFDALEPYGVLEIVRSGIISVSRGDSTIHDTKLIGQV